AARPTLITGHRQPATRRSRLPAGIADEAADSLGLRLHDLPPGSRRGDRVLEIVSRGRRSLQPKTDIAVVDATVIDERAVSVEHRGFRSDGRAGEAHER